MNIFFNGRFFQGGFNVRDGIFTDVLIAGQEDKNDDTYVIPGLVDIHTHGRTGADFSFADDKKVQGLLESYAACGVTSVLGTTMTNERKTIEDSMEAIGHFALKGPEGNEARMLGINMEGPFLGQDKKGAHDSKYLSDFDKNWLDKLLEKSNNYIRIITIDPNLNDSDGFIGYCLEKGMKVSLGHTSADYETAARAFSKGADHVTHLFNAMNPLLHRSPSLVGAAFDNKAYMEMICDGIHVDPSVIRLMFAACPDRVAVISDSMQAAGLTDGLYSLGGLDVTVSGGKATLSDGTIAGSCTDLYHEMLNLISFGISREDAIIAVTKTPAYSLGIGDKVGSICTGCFADYIVTDRNLKLQKIYVGGKEICTI